MIGKFDKDMHVKLEKRKVFMIFIVIVIIVMIIVIIFIIVMINVIIVIIVMIIFIIVSLVPSAEGNLLAECGAAEQEEEDKREELQPQPVLERILCLHHRRNGHEESDP